MADLKKTSPYCLVALSIAVAVANFLEPSPLEGPLQQVFGFQGDAVKVAGSAVACVLLLAAIAAYFALQAASPGLTQSSAAPSTPTKSASPASPVPAKTSATPKKTPAKTPVADGDYGETPRRSSRLRTRRAE
mmetsp:Transcript_7493/g.14175  ORF Transcript_7493/g.14175 Transcript_7493/m.14175 type:complete len:133 (+) Transcript_7493:84-482(+)